MKVLILFYFYTATAVHEAGALAPANVHGAAPWELAHKGVSFFLDLYGDSRT